MTGWRYLTGLMVLAIGAAGCGGSTTQQTGSGDDAAKEQQAEEPTPETFPEAVSMLKELHGELDTAFQGDDNQHVDEVWHRMARVTRTTEKLLPEAGVDRYDRDDAKDAYKTLYDAVKKTHPSHDPDAKVEPEKYNEVKESMTESIATLDRIAAKLSTEPAPVPEEAPVTEEESP